MTGADWLVAFLCSLLVAGAFGVLVYVAVDGDIPVFDDRPYEDDDG